MNINIDIGYTLLNINTNDKTQVVYAIKNVEEAIRYNQSEIEKVMSGQYTGTMHCVRAKQKISELKKVLEILNDCITHEPGNNE